MRDHSNHIQISREETVAGLLEACHFTPRIEMVRLDQAFGRVLAKDVTARCTMPNVLTCRMDSIAVRWADFENGIPDTSSWVRGRNWQFANTGTAMPEGFDTAIVIEHVSVSADEQHVKVHAAPSAQFAGTSAVGSKMKRGDILAQAGDTITPDVAARIASGNIASVAAYAKPRIAFIPTGNELVPAGSAEVPLGKNVESNSLVVRGKVEAWGGEFMPFDIVPDNPQLIIEAVKSACACADIVVLNAGSSKGSEDWSVEQLEEIGTIICHQTNHGPGHHSSAAVVDGTPVVGISGPPFGASFTLGFYLLPLMNLFLGQSPEPRKIPVRLTKAFPAAGPMSGYSAGKVYAGEERPPEAVDGTQFFSVRMLDVNLTDEGALEATPVPGRPGSAATLSANALFMLESGLNAPKPEAGDIIWAELR
ncbi:molybdopterin-binding protein [Slackia piriformis]|uniref:Molybdopterin molybdenumtransferase n=1 Tax=Slackia piriformis YIT 12062 TaxID=742818 RepID=K0YW70_9ACTN|nr:molybdopterin-binding protein [Slackia piriformis]EJZ83724.1 hypothetical protein HMPREF9451_01245 [Slackia piriformis YIT 12062]